MAVCVNEKIYSTISVNQLIAHTVRLLNEISQIRADLEAKELDLYKYVRAHRLLTRKVDEKIMIDNHTCVTATEVKGNQVLTGVNAPKEFDIYRFEGWGKIQFQKEVEHEN